MTDYRSLEHKIRDLWISEANRNTEMRKKVANVGRPEDNVKDDTSKLAKQGEIKTKIIDEASDVDTDGAFMKDKDKGAKDSKKKPDAQDEDDPREIKGGKTDVELKPTTNDSTEDSTKEDETSKKTRNKVNNEIGAKKTVKENNMSKFNFGLPESLINTVREVVEASVNEKLVGNQHKIDANKNGKIDAQDFKLLKGKKKMEEETEELDELSRKTLNSYAYKADKQLTTVNANGPSHKAGIPGHYKGKNKDLGKEPADKMRARKAGIATAVKKLNKEEVEFSEAELARLEELAKSL